VCCNRRAPAAIVFAAALFICACVASTGPSVARIAVIAPENLTGDPAFDWIGPALAAVVASEAEGHETVFVFSASSYAEAVNRRAQRAVHGRFSRRPGGLVYRFDVEDMRTSRIVRRLAWRAAAEDLLDMARRLGEELGVRRRPFPATDLEALRQFAGALTAADPRDRRKALEAALQAAPSFHNARFLLADLLLDAGDAEGARRTLDAAPQTGLDEIAAARSALLQARLAGGREQVAAALERLARLLPADAQTAARAAQEFLSLHQYAGAAEWYGRAAAADPENPVWWNARAYAAAYAGDAATAFESLERYREADPDNPNPLDSRGELCFRFGRLAEAERSFLEAYGMNPDFLGGVPLLKAAWCRLFAGDRSGARELFEQFAQAARDLGDRRIALDEARWLYWTGRRREALAELQRAIEHEILPPRFQAAAHVQLAAWELLAANAAEARRRLEEAARLARGRLAGEDALLVWQLTGPRKGQRLPSAAAARIRLLAEAYGLLLGGNPAAAEEPLRRIWDASPPLERDVVGVLLGWASLEAGRLDEAARLLEPNPIWRPRAESAFHSLVFPRLFYLRGALAARTGRNEAAIPNLRLFLEYSGDLPDAVGHEEAARRLLARLSAGGDAGQ